MRALFTLPFLACLASAAVINFDDLPASSGGVVTPGGVTPFVGQTVPSNYTPLATFSVPGGALFVYAEAVDWAGPPPASPPNVVCPAQVALASSNFCTEALLVTFSTPVNALSFWAAAWDDVGSVLTVLIYTGSNSLAGQIEVTSPQRANTQGIIDVSGLSGIANITGLRIVSPSATATAGPVGDRNGLVYDNFVFDASIVPPPPSNVPEPGTLALAGLGLAAALGFQRQRVR